jgi:uncharacterized membrane protein
VTPQAATVHSPSRRITAIDGVRGIIMIVMALDHVRDFIHRAAMSTQPTDLAATTPLIFLTRWVTHLCAPMFMLTAGIGAYLWWTGGRTTGQLSAFLLTRGVWLVILELTVMRAAYNFTLAAHYPVFLLVLWALGGCMIVLAAAVWLPYPALALASAATIGLHNLLDPVTAARFGRAAWGWNLLHQPGAFPAGGAIVILGYPLVPWVAVMTAGFCLGRLYLLDPGSRRRILTWTGAALVTAFLVVRAVNQYGDPAPWAPHPSNTLTVLSFLNTTKYPPSLAFLLMTLGPGLLLLAWFEHRPLASSNPLVRLGRVPLFYFVLHFYAVHAVAAILAVVRYGGGAVRFIFNPVPSMGGPRELYPDGFGYDLPAVYLVWALTVAALYPACRWFESIKAQRPDGWRRYL